MKKYFISFLVIGIIVLTGCSGGKSLTCTLNQDGASASVKGTFKKDRMTKLVVNLDVSADGTLTEQEIKQTKEYLDSSFCSTIAGEGVTCTPYADKSGKSSVNITIDVGKATEDAIGNMNYKETYEGFKKDLEGKGYTCK